MTEDVEQDGRGEGRPRCENSCAYAEDGVICAWCDVRLWKRLVEIPIFWDDLHDLDDLPGTCPKHPEQGSCTCGRPASGPLLPAARGSDRVSGTKERPLGVNVAVLSFIGAYNDPGLPPSTSWWDALDRDEQVGERPLMDTLINWTTQVAESTGFHPPNRTVTGQVAYLKRHHEHAISQTYADEYATEIGNAWRTARRLAGKVPQQPEHIVGLPCPREVCDEVELYRHAGDDRVECGACGYRFDEDDINVWAKLYIEGETWNDIPKRASEDTVDVR